MNKVYCYYCYWYCYCIHKIQMAAVRVVMSLWFGFVCQFTAITGGTGSGGKRWWWGTLSRSQTVISSLLTSFCCLQGQFKVVVCSVTQWCFSVLSVMFVLSVLFALHPVFAYIYNTIQLYCLYAEKFAFWLVIYIKTFNTVNNKISTTQ